MAPLEKQNQQYEAMQSELEEKNVSLKRYQQISEERDSLKEENSKLLALKKNLENQLKESNEKDYEITQLKMEKKKLKKNIHKTQEALEKLELKNQKDLRDMPTQTNFLEEPKIDKAKVKLLFEELWMCIEPESQTTNPLHYSGYQTDSLKPRSVPIWVDEVVPEATGARKIRKSSRESGERLNHNALVKEKKFTRPPDSSPLGSSGHDIEKILDLFKPLPPILSPMCFTTSQETLFGDMSDSSDDDKNEGLKVTNIHQDEVPSSRPECADLQHLELSTNKTADTLMMLAPAPDDSLDPFSALCTTLIEVGKDSGDKEMNIHHSEIQIRELEEEKFENAEDITMWISDEALVDGLAASPSGSCVKESLSREPTELSTPGNSDSLANVVTNAEAMVVGEAPPEEKETDAEYVNYEKAFPISQQNKHTEDHQGKCDTQHRDSIKEPQLPPTGVNNDNLGHYKDIDVHLQTPAGLANLVKGSLSNGFTQLQESSETERENPLSTLNDVTNDNMETEQTASNMTCSQANEVNTVTGKLTRFEANAVDGLAASPSGSCVKESLSSGVPTELSIPGNTDNSANVVTNAEAMVVGEAPPEEKETDAEYVNCEKAFPISQQNKHTEDHQGKCDTQHRDSIKEPQLPPPGVNNDNLGLYKDIDVHLQTPTGLENLVKDSLSNGFTQLQESSETERENPLSTLNDVTKDNTETEQTASNMTCSQANEVNTVTGKLTRFEANAADGPEERIRFSEDNCIVNSRVLDLVKSTSKSLHCPNDGMDQAKEQAADGFPSDITTETDVTLTLPSTLLTVSELPARAVSPKDELEALESVQNEALSELSKHSGEMVCTSKESQKPNELEVNTHDAEGLKQTCQLPAGSVLASPSDPTVINIDVHPGRINPPCSDVTPPVVEADSTPAEIPADEGKIEGSDPAKCKESSDEQESFGLQRKVKKIYQRAGNQASSESVNVLIKAEGDSTRPHEGSGNSQGTSCERQETHSLNTGSCYLTSHDSSHVKLALSTNSIQSEVSEDGIPIQETFAGMLQCERKMSNDHEEPLKQEIKECKPNVSQSGTIRDHGCCLSPKFSSELKERPCSLQADERTDENTTREIEQEVAVDKTEVKKSSISNDKGFPTESTMQAMTFKNPAIPSRKRQHSSKGQENLSMNVKEELKLTNTPTLASADAPTPAKSPESIRKVRFEMGPPLPPLLNPLTVTPPRFGKLKSKTIPSKLSFPSPMSEEMQEDSITPPLAPLSDGPNAKPPCLSLPSSCETKCKRVLSSPLQFCATTPKHAVPVPGRLPPSASSSSSSSPSAPQENSVTILDTMYPDLSARARTLNILRRTVNLSRCTSANGITPHDPVNQISRFKAVNSSTVFTKSSQSSECELRQTVVGNTGPSKGSSSALAGQFAKRTGVNMLLPRSVKKPRWDGDLPDSLHDRFPKNPEGVSQGESARIKEGGQVGNAEIGAPNPISDALKEIETSCFDLLPVIKSHVSIGRISEMPLLRDEEVEVIRQFCAVKKLLADDLLSAILVKMKAEKSTLCGPHMQALCRVYTGICRQREDWERAHLFAYSILKEDFPDSAKLILFMVTTWHNILSKMDVLSQAMHAVVRLRAHGEVLHYLTAYLNWEMNPPCDVQKLISNTLMALRTGENMKFLHHVRHGDDLNPAAWAHIFTLDLLCTQQRWKWTHDNIIRKELWPLMNSWVAQPRWQQTPISDVSIATVLRLIGRLGQLGIKEKAVGQVKTFATAINLFGRHGKKEDVPWSVQLAAVYAIYDLSPSNPKEALDALAAWRGETSESVPPAVTSCITQIGSVCRYVKS
ncbi:hypothetical protein AAFF_G00364960 [Aldrovandia affinis]|uniref:Little elongation complex subunit 1 C-terminal domain-containing protein n=1 Tax=Aldrovandia affinis TaxID=143900 RepID=A0AAD7WNS5_9TELE|nr:hypothetical protein AAFF_G00364960 [Aldrovandia affinis]